MISITSLETSKALKLDGFPQDTQFCWTFDYVYTLGITEVSLFGQPVYAAPTTDEILARLKNIQILQYADDVMTGFPIKDFIDLFRDANELAKVYLWLSKENLLKEKL